MLFPKFDSKDSMVICRLWTTTLLAVISAVRIGMGLFVGVRGPTLLYLARNVDSNVAAISYIFVFRSIGVVMGAIASGAMKRWTKPGFRHMYVLGLVVLLFGICSLTIPPIRSISLLYLNITVGNLMYGYLDAGLQALLLALYGEKASRPFIQLFHFMFSIGAFLGPIIANPFLVKTEKMPHGKANYPKNNSDAAFELAQQFNIHSNASVDIFTDSTINDDTLDVVQWVFYIIGVWIVAVGFAMLALARLSIEAKIPTAGSGSKDWMAETMADEPLKDVIWILLIIVLFYITNVSTESVFYYYLYPVVICSKLQLSVSAASYLNSIMWLGLGFGRLVATIAVNFVTPKTIIVIGIVGSILDGLLMCIWGETTAWIAWLVAFSHLFTTGVFYPSGVSWASTVTNVSGMYQFIFALGSAIGGATMLPLSGHLFDINPFNVIYVVFALAAANGIVFFVASFMGRSHRDFYITKNTMKSDKELTRVPLKDVEETKDDCEHTLLSS